MPAGVDSKPFFQKLLRPATRVAAAAGITPNQVTAATMILSLAAGAMVLLRPEAPWALLLIPGALMLRVAFNHIDGMLACEHAMKTRLGAILNELADVVSDAALYLPLAAVPGTPAALLVAAVMLGVIAEMTGVVAMQIGADRRQDGPLAKKPRGLVFGGSALAMGLGVAPGAWLDAVLLAALALLLLTIVNRVTGALEQAARRCSPL